MAARDVRYDVVPTISDMASEAANVGALLSPHASNAT